jgi:hypothetical protein
MTSVDFDTIITTYLEELNDALATLPAAERRQLLESITGHIDEARAAAPADSEVAVREILEHLGRPSEIAASAVADRAVPAGRRRLKHRKSIVGGGSAVVVAGAVVLPRFLVGTFTSPTTKDVAVPDVVSLWRGSAVMETEAAGLKPWLRCEPNQPVSAFANRVNLETPAIGYSLLLGSYVTIGVASSLSGCHATVPSDPPAGLIDSRAEQPG